MPRKTIVWIAMSVLFLAAAGLAADQQKKPDAPTGLKIESRPDLVVVSIEFKNYLTSVNASGVKIGSVIPSVTYKNQGSASSGTFELSWEYWDYANNKWQWHLSTGLTNNLGAGQSFTQGGQPADAFTWVMGSNWPKFRCRLDIKSAVTESLENNNELEKTYRPLTAGEAAGTGPIIKK